ncbi:hypothetical protein AAC387_Pa09g1995 [Persea americana]
MFFYLMVGDGSGGGGILLVGKWWDKKALDLAEEVCISFGGDLKIYAFKTSASSTIKVLIENMENKYGSPSITDIEDFSSAYRARLDEAEVAGATPDNYSLEVSSPGVERIVQIPQELDWFKNKPMYVKKRKTTQQETKRMAIANAFDSLRLVRLYYDC